MHAKNVPGKRRYFNLRRCLTLCGYGCSLRIRVLVDSVFDVE